MIQFKMQWYIGVDKGVLVGRFKVWRTRKSMVPLNSSTSLKQTGIQNNDTIKLTTPQCPTDDSIKPMGNLWTKQATDGVKRPTGPACLSLISTNICTRKYLVSHDQPSSKESLQGKDPAKYVYYWESSLQGKIFSTKK